jgi:hypothetical protein
VGLETFAPETNPDFAPAISRGLDGLTDLLKDFLHPLNLDYRENYECSKPAPTRKGMYWTGVVSVIPSLMLLMASVMSLSKSAQALQGMAQLATRKMPSPQLARPARLDGHLHHLAHGGTGAILLTGYLGGAVETHARRRRTRFSCRSSSPHGSGWALFRDAHSESAPWRK